MPEMKRNFTKGKMNKDLDERLVPNGEYRDAMNVQVSTSEGSDVGTIQNVLGNTPGCEYVGPNPIHPGSSVVGSVSDEKNDSLYWLIAGPPAGFLDPSSGNYYMKKDMIMRTNSNSPSGCEPVFVDIYNYVVNNTSIETDTNLLNSPGIIDFATFGMTATGFDANGLVIFSQPISGVGSINTIPNINYTNVMSMPTITNVFPYTVMNQGDAYITCAAGSNQFAPGNIISPPPYNNGDLGAYLATSFYVPALSGYIYPYLAGGQFYLEIWDPGGNVITNSSGSNYWDYYVGNDWEFGSFTPLLTFPNAADILTFQDLFESGTYDLLPPIYGLMYTGCSGGLGAQVIDMTGWAYELTHMVSSFTNQIIITDTTWLDEINLALASGLNVSIDANASWPTGNACIVAPILPPFGLGVYNVVDCNTLAPIYPISNNPITLSFSSDLSLNAAVLAENVDLSNVSTIQFGFDRVLNFQNGNLILGINIIDDLLFWTDNFTEPKKINIPRSVAGTDILGNTHTAVVNNPINLNILNYNPIREEHITVIRKNPKNALNLEFSTGKDPDLLYSGITYTAIDPNTIAPPTNYSSIISSSNNTVMFDFSTLQVGDTVQFEIETDVLGNENFTLEWSVGDTLLLKEFDEFGVAPAVPLADWTIRGRITSWVSSSFVNDTTAGGYAFGLVGSDWPASAPGTAHIEMEVLSLDGTPPQVDPLNVFNPDELHYVVDLETKEERIFENKFPRFSYRYKYADGEYSIFAPWSQVAFSPSNFNYETKRGWNTGMTNSITSINIKGFVPTVFGQPIGQDVVEVDILYKEEGAPNVYVVETISPLDIAPPGSINAWWKNEYELKSLVINYTLPSNQLLRSWDAVPKKALAQDISGNRIVYANYEQNFDLDVIDPLWINSNGMLQKFKPKFKNSLAIWRDFDEGAVEKSIKSLRDYKLGVVFTDEYGRETPILISDSGGFKVDKKDSPKANRLIAGLEGIAPNNADYFKFFVKETSTEYYNLAMDRWYDAADGNIWIAFPSTDRNKVDLETSLYFKKGTGDEAIENSHKYKILALENEAPDFIKTRRIRIGVATHNPLNTGGVPVGPLPIELFGTGVGSNALDEAPLVNGISFTMNWSPNATDFLASSMNHLEEVSEDLYIQFVSNTDYSAQYLISEITSDREDASTDTVGGVIGGGANVTKYFVTLDTNLKEDINFIFDNAANPSQILPFVKVQITKAIVENKPKYDGRFFAKIENDGNIKAQIDNDAIGATAIEIASKMVYALDHDEDLMVRSKHAAFSSNLHDNLMSENLITYDFENNIYTPITLYSHDINTNPGKINWNYHYARASYFGPGLINQEGPGPINTGGALNAGVNYPRPATENWTFANSVTTYGLPTEHIIDQGGYGGSVIHPKWAPLPGVWFIDRSTTKHSSYSANGANTDMNWTTYASPNSNFMPNFSPSMMQGIAEGWSVTNTMGGISNYSNNTSQLTLAFGGIENFGVTGSSHLSQSSDTKTGSDQWGSYQGYGGLFPDFFSVGQSGIGNYGDSATVRFAEGLSPGTKFKWAQDPTETIYQLINQVTVENRVRFGKTDGNIGSAAVGLAPQRTLTMLGSHSSYHKMFRTKVEPDMADWDPAGPVGTHMTKHLHLEDMTVSYEFVYGAVGNNTNSATADDNYIIVDTLNSVCSNPLFPNTLKPRYTLQEGMMLTGYNLDGAPLQPTHGGVTGVSNIIIKSIGPFDPSAPGGTGGYKITLTGYYEPLHLQNANFELGNGVIGNDRVAFKQVAMNGASNFTESNTDYYKSTHWANDNGTGTTGGIGGVGYELVMVELVDEYSDGGNLPPNPYIWETEPKDDTGLDIYYEISENNPINLNPSTIASAIPIGSKVSTKNGYGVSDWSGVEVAGNISATGDIIDLIFPSIFGAWIGPGTTPGVVPGSVIQPLIIGAALLITKPNGVTFNVTIANIIPDPGNLGYAFSFQLDQSLYNSSYYLNWHNCYSFGNGVESNRIKDNYNLPFILSGIKVSTTLGEDYKVERRKHGLIYSGIYNSTSGVNNLNQFIAAEKITKDINPIYGSIQRLKAGWGQGGDLIALCEDRVLKILADKDALFNADGNANVTATNRVLGTATPYSGEYGISTNPESFASESYRAYFTDKVRGAVMRLSRDGLTPISDAGMRDWFRDNLKLSDKLVGSFDDKKDEYNISLTNTTEGVGKSVTFREDVRGWVSFKSFITKNGISCANEYYTFEDGDLWRHHHDVPLNRNTFYNYSPISSSFTVLLNDAPDLVKSFYTLNYEGSDSKVTQNVGDDQYYNINTSTPGWYVDSIFTNKETGDIYEFIEKEGKWFNYIRGTNIVHDQVDNIMINPDGSSTWDQASFAIQGLGALNGLPSNPSVLGCTDPTAQNYNPLATLDDSSCIPAVMITGCTHATAVGYNPLANTDDGTCMWPGCVCNPNSYPGGCTNPTFFNNQAQNYMGIGIQDDGSCIAIVLGCTTLGQFGYNPLANTDDGSCTPIVGGCVGQNNIPAQSVINPNPSANTDDGSCQWEFCGESSDASYNSAAAAESNNYAVAGPGYINDAVGCTSGGCMDATAFNYNGGINPSGNIVEWDDGSCIPITYGCMDGGVDDYTSSFGDGGDGYTAANYDATVNTDDGSCYYITTCYKCGNHSVSGAPGYIETVDINFTSPNVCPGIWMDSSQAISAFGANFNVDDCCILGCTDPLYTEYSPLATCDDGSCVTLVALCDPYTYTVDSVVQPSAPGLTDGTITVTINSPNYLFTGLFGQFAFSYNPSPIPALPPPFIFIYNWSNGNSTVTITLNGIGEVGLFTLSIYDQTNFSNACPMLEEDFTFPSLAVPGCMTMGATNYTGPGSGVIPEATVDDGSCVWVISGDSIIAPGVDTCQMLNYQPACAPGCVFLNMGGTLDQALCDCCNDNNTVPNIEAQGNIYYGCNNAPWGC